MAALFNSYKEKTIGVAIQQLKDQNILFLVGSGDIRLDKEIENFISDSFSSQFKIISDVSAQTNAELMNVENKGRVFLFPEFKTYLDNLDTDSLQDLIQQISNSGKWTSFVIFQISEGINEVDYLLNKLVEINYILIKSLHVISRVPAKFYNELIIDSLSKHGVDVDNETNEAMQSDERSFSLSYTYIELFAEKVLIHLEKLSKNQYATRLLDLKEYESVGTLRYFIEYTGKSFLDEAESFSTFQHIEYVFRSLILFKNEKAERIQLSKDQVSQRSGIPLDQVEKILELGCEKRFHFLEKTNDLYSIASEEYLIHWSDLKKWVSSEFEAIELYVKYCKLADAYERGETQLLNGIQLEETERWRQSNPINLYWAQTYHPAFEKVISYLNSSHQSNQENLEAQERSRSRRLKMAYSIAWASVLGLMVILGFGIWARQEQVKAVKAEAMSKQSNIRAVKALGLAEQRTEEAIKAQSAADKSRTIAIAEANNALQAKKKEELQKLKAIDAEKKAVIEREYANAARDDASRAKDQAVENRKIAEKAESEAKENFQKANQLRIQQEARANALSVFEDYDNNNFIQGRQKATDAYQLYKNQGGNPFEKDILNSLFVGLIREDIKKHKEDISYQPTRMNLNNSLDRLAIHGNDGIVRVYDLKNSRKVIQTFKADKINGLAFLDNDILMSQQGSLYIQSGTNKVVLLTSEAIGKTIKGFYLLENKNKTICVYTQDALILYAFQKDQQLKLIKSIPVYNPGNLNVVKNELYFSSGKQLMVTDQLGLSLKSIITFKSPISAISGAMSSGLIAIGDEEGNLYLVDPKTSEIKSERNKLHLSRISGLQTILSPGSSDILMSVGFDASVNIFYLGELSKNYTVLPTPITLKEHKGWITSLLINSKAHQAITSSNDKSIRFWPLIPDQLVYNPNKK